MDFERFKKINDDRVNNFEMEDADVVSSYRNIGCGDGFRIYLKIDQEEIITDASFTTTGCGFGMVSLAMACEWAKAKPVTKVASITSKDIEEIFEFPPKRKNYPDSAVEAMQKAIQDYKNGTGIKLEDRVTKQYALDLLKEQGHPRGAKLNQIILEGEDFTGVDFTGADLSHAFLQKVNFTDANLSGVRLRGAFLNDAILNNTNFSESDLRWCKLTGAKTEGANFKDAKYDIGTRLDPRQTHLFGMMQKMDAREIYTDKPAEVS